MDSEINTGARAHGYGKAPTPLEGVEYAMQFAALPLEGVTDAVDLQVEPTV
jgi:hypothetical protein